MSKNGIAWLPTKEQRQIAKLELAAAKRGQSYDRDLLPTKYVGNDVVNNPNPGGLQPQRPWTTGTPGPGLTPYPQRTNYAFDFVTPPTSGTVWNDDVNQVSIAINGTGTRSFANGRGIIFNGTNTYLEISNITDGISTVTISMAADFQSANGNWNPVYHGGSYGGSEVFAYIPGAADVDINVGTGDTRSMPAPTLVSGLAWWDFVYSGTSIKVYKNGIQVISDTIGNPNTGFTSPLLIGARYDTSPSVNNGDFLNGTIYRIKGVLSALTPVQVATQYNSIRTTYSLPAIPIVPSTLTSGTSLAFNGSDLRYAVVSGSLGDWNLGDIWTIEWWQNIPVGASGFLSVLCQDANVPTYSGIDVFINAGNIQMFNGGRQTSESAATRGQWNHIALQKNGTDLTAYINGVAQTFNGSHSGTIAPSSPLNVAIGSRTWDGGVNHYGQYFNGQLANIRISNVARYSATFQAPTTVVVDANVKLALDGSAGASGMLDDVSASNHLITNYGAVVTSIGGTTVYTAVTPNNGTSPGSVYFLRADYPGIENVPVGATMTGPIFADPGSPVTITVSQAWTPNQLYWYVNYQPIPGGTQNTSPGDTFVFIWTV